MKVHLINAAKYFTVMLVYFANVFRIKLESESSFLLYVCISIFSTLFSYSWDLYMDWGLLRSKEPGRIGLRPKILMTA